MLLLSQKLFVIDVTRDHLEACRWTPVVRRRQVAATLNTISQLQRRRQHFTHQEDDTREVGVLLCVALKVASTRLPNLKRVSGSGGESPRAISNLAWAILERNAAIPVDAVDPTCSVNLEGDAPECVMHTTECST